MVKVPKVLKRIGEELALEGSLEVCRGFLLERLRQVSPDDLYKAIVDNVHTMDVAEKKDRTFSEKMAKRFRDLSYMGKKAQEHLAPELVLEWLKEDRVDLASLLINMKEKGIDWLREDIKQVREFLFGVEK